MGDKKLSEAEAFIMEWFWEKGPMKTGELGELVAAKGWKPTTLLTFLSRLVDKGMLRAEKQGKANLYTPLCTREQYRAGEGRVFLDEMYGGSARNFIAALVDGRGIRPEELDELKKWLEDQEVERDG